MRPIIIVGAGLAGAKAAETLRDEGFDGPVVLLGDEPDRPYERPPLSKGLLLGTADRDSVFIHAADWYDTHGVDLRTGARVTAMDRSSHRVELADGQRLDYHALLLATGARPRTLSLPGGDLDGVRYLRTLADRDHLATALTEGANIVIVGAGWIGLEVAAAARARGANVTVLETAALCRCAECSATRSPPSSPTCTATTGYGSASALNHGGSPVRAEPVRAEPVRGGSRRSSWPMAPFYPPTP